jgi:FkbH-like protein
MVELDAQRDQIIQLIHEIERDYGRVEVDKNRRLAQLLEGLITELPQEALRFFKGHKDNGVRCVAGLQSLINALAIRLLAKQEIDSVEEVLQLAMEWRFSVDAAVLQKLAKIYRHPEHCARGCATLKAVLKSDPTHAPEILRYLYDLARAESRDAEAHAFLLQLIQTDPSPATITFAHRERGHLLPESGPSVRIALLSSYTIDPLVPYLDAECRAAGLVPEFYVAPFNQYMQEVLQSSSGLYRFKPDIIFIALAIDDLFPAVRRYPLTEELDNAHAEVCERIRRVVDEAHQHSDALVVVHEFVLLNRSPHGILDNRSANGLNGWIERLNRHLAGYLRTQERGYLLPLGDVLGWAGKAQSHDPKLQYMAGMRLSGAALPELARHSMRYVKPLKGLTRKCVVLDLDGTLWGGLAGELGIEGIQLGPLAPGVEYVDFQEALLSLTRRGILLAVCSKNSPDDVLPIIRNHPHMRLREEHFAAARINWRNKAENITELAEELNIGLDSMVFFDDNPNERELIRQLLPEVLTVDLPTDPARYRTTLEEMSEFELLALTKEDEQRSAQYQAMRQRRVVRNAAASLEDYLHSLELKAIIEFAISASVNRLVQMFNKTNQFNLTTRRYQAADMNRFIASEEYRLYTLDVCDRFGDHGLVGAAIVRAQGDSWLIDSLLMSCRVMGLSVETAFLHRIYNDALQAGVKTLIGEFISTKKNQPVEHFYSSHGFSQMKEPDRRHFWELNIGRSKVERPAWITVTGASQKYDG